MVNNVSDTGHVYSLHTRPTPIINSVKQEIQ